MGERALSFSHKTTVLSDLVFRGSGLTARRSAVTIAGHRSPMFFYSLSAVLLQLHSFPCLPTKLAFPLKPANSSATGKPSLGLPLFCSAALPSNIPSLTVVFLFSLVAFPQLPVFALPCRLPMVFPDAFRLLLPVIP